MSIRRDLVIKVSNGSATLDMPLQIYEKDHGIELRFKLMDYKYKYDKDPENILNSNKEDILEAYTTIVNPSGYELAQINGEVVEDTVKFMIEDSYTDELEELGTYQLQIHVKCKHSEFSIPPVRFEVLERLKGEKVVTDGDDEVDYSDILDGSTKFINDETGKLIIKWQKGDTISSVKLNAMVEVINNAVDEEVQRQLNEVKREQQELERENKLDESMIEYETRFNALTASQQQDMEVIDARDGEVSLKARLDRDVKNPLQVYEDVEGSYISCDSTVGYAQNIEILGNTIQDADNLADIRSVGGKVEGQELYKIDVVSYGKNLYNENKMVLGMLSQNSGEIDYYVQTYLSYEPYIKVKPSTTYVVNKQNVINVIVYYDKDKKYIDDDISLNSSFITFITPSNCEFIRFRIASAVLPKELQLEEGTVATPYEPYQEDKLTILSPIQLEKVGDVADRIICKDGVWGVEKNIETVIHDGSINWGGTNVRDNTVRFQTGMPNSTNGVINILNNRFPIKNIYSTDEVGIEASNKVIYISVLKSELSSYDSTGISEWLKYNPLIVKYPTTQPSFIPLPYDQQIKLRTFAGKTNIHFDTEIEGTIKASIPQSISAAISTHAEQIDNLNKELGKVKKLEESTTSHDRKIAAIETKLEVPAVQVEGSYISCDNNEGYAKNVEILGNTVQDAENLADIRSVGDKVEGQELYKIDVVSCGKNLLNIPEHLEKNMVWKDNNKSYLIDYVKLKPNTDYKIKGKYSKSNNEIGHGGIGLYLFNSIPQAEDVWLVGQTPKRIVYENENYTQDINITINSGEYKYLAIYLGIATDNSYNNSHNHIATLKNFQLEEGTQATSYEPYQEDKLTILSPVQLEKVGDVTDRIICKDGVWGIEKNIKTTIFDGSESWSIKNQALTLTTRFGIQFDDPKGDSILISNRLPNKTDGSQYTTDEVGISINNSKLLCFRVLKTELSDDSVNGGKKWLSQNNLLVKYPTTQPQFIPLPYDQQIKLRTFAGKTNIHFDTEIEGTIKASIPQSISSTISTHTEQIDNLNKELDRVKKLEESTVSTVTTESDFTTVTETTNGYFEDVKLEGRTLVNVAYKPHLLLYITHVDNEYVCNNVGTQDDSGIQWREPGMFKNGQIYTIIFTVRNTSSTDIELISGYDMSGTGWRVIATIPANTSKRVIYTKQYTNTNINYCLINLACNTAGASFAISDDILILEGDHTQNPPEYFEGLMSVGEDVDEMTVESVTRRLFDLNTVNQDWLTGAFDTEISSDNLDYHSCEAFDVSSLRNKQIYIRVFRDGVFFNKAYPLYVCVFDENKIQIEPRYSADNMVYLVPSNAKYMRIMAYIRNKNSLAHIDRDEYYVRLTPFKDNEQLIPHQSNKKPLLYYNPTTQAWEKPILREWDSIEKHSDGKYYYHKRSGEVVLDGSEDWQKSEAVMSTDTQVWRYWCDPTFVTNKPMHIKDNKTVGNIVSDKFIGNTAYDYCQNSNNPNYLTAEYISLAQGSTTNGYFGICILTSKLSTQDVAGFKAWLQTNPTTVVYQLATEEVYECINIDLITYENETNYIVNTGAIAPLSTLKVMRNINNVVRELQQKVSNLENYIQHVMIDALNNALNE